MFNNLKYRIRGTSVGYDIIVVGILLLILTFFIIKKESQKGGKKNSIESEISTKNKIQASPMPEAVNSPAEPNNSVGLIETTKNCLVNYDWTYPSKENPVSAWKFSSDGTFNFGTKMFGGMTAWGNWVIENSGVIRITYTRSTEGKIPLNQTLILPDCKSLKVGNTIYSRE